MKNWLASVSVMQIHSNKEYENYVPVAFANFIGCFVSQLSIDIQGVF